jgi:hypothetical protein
MNLGAVLARERQVLGRLQLHALDDLLVVRSQLTEPAFFHRVDLRRLG